MKRIFVTEDTFLIKNLFYVTKSSTHYDMFFPEGIVKLTKPLRFENSLVSGFRYISIYSTPMKAEKSSLFVSANRKNEIDFHHFNSFVDLKLNYKITNALLTFLNYEE